MSANEKTPLSDDELAAEGATALPDKEVVSLLDLDANIDLVIDAAAPIDLAVAANANIAAPIDAAVSANVLSAGSMAQALGSQSVDISQGITGDSTATGLQDSAIDQGDGGVAAQPAGPLGDAAGIEQPQAGALPDAEVPTPDLNDALSGPLLDVNVDLSADADLAAPINGAVAAQANVAAPIDAAVAGNIGSIGSEATAVAQQDAIIDQSIDGNADATSDQTSDIGQGSDTTP